MLAAEKVKVFWQPGCTSCLRTKEFLTKSGVEYESINVHGNPAGMEELRKLGARSVPVVARGDQFVFAQAIGDVIKFLDLKMQEAPALRSGKNIARFGESVLARLQAWWKTYPDRSCSRMMDTYFGKHPLHVVLERTAWHPAQHTRQLMLILETLNIEPNRRLTAADLAGLPLPDKAWDDEKEAA